MLSAIIRGKTTSCCSLGTGTSAASNACNAASDWVGSCAITIKRQHNPPPGLRDEMGHASGRSRKSDGFLHFRRLHLRGGVPDTLHYVAARRYLLWYRCPNSG